MGAARTATGAGAARWSRAAANRRSAGGAERDRVRVADRLPVAVPAGGIPEVEYRLLVLRALDRRRDVGARQRPPPPPAARSDRARCRSERRDHRQSIGEDHGKGGDRGFDAGKKVNGRKRHILVDTEGLLIRAAVLSAGIQDADGATDLLALARPACPRLEQLWADAAYAGYLVEWTREQCGWRLVIVNKSPDQVGFQVLPRRWVVER